MSPMSIIINPELEKKLRDRAESEGISVEAYVERMVRVEFSLDDELERTALEGINSGDAIEITDSFWVERHRVLDEHFKK
jgi:hypothetical protein